MIAIDDLCIEFPTEGHVRRVVDTVSFRVERGRTLGIVGESGSGKSMTALALMGLVPTPGRIARGTVTFDGIDITRASEPDLRTLRGGRIAMIFQDPSSAFNPVFTIGDQIAEAYRMHHAVSRSEAHIRAVDAMAEVGIADAKVRAGAYPHHLSGGMRQRCMIAMALINEPELLIADEPTTALDVTIQAQILALMRDIQVRREIGMIFITHNLAVVADMADDIIVMQAGQIVERGDTARLFTAPQHAYTRRLIDAVTLPPAQPPAPSGSTPLVEVAHLTKRFALRAPGPFGRQLSAVQALSDISFDIRRGETFAIVGESGSGKSTLAKTLLGLTAADDGAIRIDGRSIPANAGARTPTLRRRLQMVFQDPYASLNPRMSAGDAIAEPLRIHKIGTRVEQGARVAEAATAVGIDPGMLGKYPHEFSGGERQRIAIARAIIAEPDMILADEPLSSLDVTIQAQVIKLLRALKDRLGLTYLFISHDLSVVAHMADRVAVMYAGRIVEQASAESLFKTPHHPYTKALLDSAPAIGRIAKASSAIGGEPPSMMTPPSGCAYHPRCPKSQEICAITRPELAPAPTGTVKSSVACHFPITEHSESSTAH
jgi:oligopeptide/dipeptide ABC transporter ATP-binding protein